MQIKLNGLRVLITAGGSGIGKAIAERFLENGGQVHICDIDAEALAQCRTAYPGLGMTQTDVSDPDQVAHLFEVVEANLGGLDVLVNNAGIAGPTAPVEAVTPQDWDKTLAVNINGHFYCTRLAVPLFKAAGGGSIVNLSSTAGLFGYPRRTPYAASKWAVIGFTKSLAMELGEFGIRVNAICPGPIEGERMGRVIQSESQATGIPPEDVKAGYLNLTSMHTFISPYEIADIVLFICSEAGSKISGQALSVDGHTETLRIHR